MNFKRLITVGLIAVGLYANPSNAQNINLFAGVPLNAGNTGDGGAATSAKFISPHTICIDKSGNVYIADMDAHRVRIVDASGTVNAFAGTGTGGNTGDGSAATSATLGWPSGLAVDTSGNVYISDVYYHVIRKVNSAGIISTIAGTGTQGFSGDGSAATSAALNFPVALGLDAIGNLFVVDRVNARIREIDTAGIINTVVGTGTQGYYGDGGAATSAQINYPANVTFDGSGNMYIADQINQRIRKVNTSGTISTIVGVGTAGFSGDSSAATSAELNSPFSVVFDTSGNMFIADEGNNRVRMVDLAGNIYTYAGDGTHGYGGDGGPAISAQLTPLDVKVNSDNTLLIADMIHNNVREIEPGVLSIEEFKKVNNALNLYPNANNGTFTLSGTIDTKNDVVQLDVLDITGKIIFADNARVKNKNLNKQITLPESTPAGHYILRVTGGKRTRTFKFDKK